MTGNGTKPERSWKKPRTCKWCGESFKPVKGGQRYCCRSCGRNDKRTRWYPNKRKFISVFHKTCPECGDEYDTIHAHQVYCHDRCRWRVNSRVRYWLNKRELPDKAREGAERKKRNAKAWRDRNVLMGRCSRCGSELPDGCELHVCDDCRKNLTH